MHKPILSRLWRIAFAVVLPVMLSGCATDSILNRPQHPTEVVFQPGHGVVLLDLAANGNVSQVFDKWQRIAIRNVNDNEKYNAYNLALGYQNRSLFMLSLPEGEYFLEELGNFSSIQTPQLYSNVIDTAKLGEKYGKFRIQAGKVTNLGTLVYLRPKLGSGKEFSVEFWPGSLELEKFLETFDPAVSRAAKTGALTWLPNSGGVRSHGQSKSPSGKSFSLNGPFYGKDGALYFGEAFGQIARRDPSGRWTWLQTEATSPILSTAVLDDGSLLAGSEQGLLFLRKPDEGQWKVVPFPKTAASIRFLGSLPGHGIVAVAHDRQEIFVLSLPSTEQTAWSELKRLPIDILLPSGYGSPFKAWIDNDRLVIARQSPTGLSRRIMFHEFDARTGSWKETPVVRGIVHMDYFSLLPNGFLFTLSGAPLAQDAYASMDGGETWEKRNSPNWLDLPAFRNPKEGYAVRLDNTPLTDPLNTSHSIWKTTDGGNNWVSLNKAPNQSIRFLLLDKPGEMMIATRDNKLYFSNDWGATWKLERSM